MREFLSGLDTNEFFSVFKNPWKVRKTILFIFKLLWSFGYENSSYILQKFLHKDDEDHKNVILFLQILVFFLFKFYIWVSQIGLYYRHSQIRNYTFYIPLDNQEYLISSFISGFKNKLNTLVLAPMIRSQHFSKHINEAVEFRSLLTQIHFEVLNVKIEESLKGTLSSTTTLHFPARSKYTFKH